MAQDMTDTTQASKTKSQTGEWLETFKTIVYAVLLALLIRTFIFEPFSIPSTSMLPSLLVGDYIIVSKYSYGYSKHSMPLSLPLFDGRVDEEIPKRGDVIVFKLPRDNRTDYIKRLIGLPGDEIQVKKGILYINGKAVTRARIEDYVDQPNSPIPNVAPTRFMQYRETLPDGGLIHPILELTDEARLDNTPVYKVPEGHYFFMGDNRDNSMDSRVESSVGFVPAENLIGQAKYVFFSMKGGSPWWQIWNWPFAIRYDRLLVKIH